MRTLLCHADLPCASVLCIYSSSSAELQHRGLRAWELCLAAHMEPNPGNVMSRQTERRHERELTDRKADRQVETESNGVEMDSR